MRMLTMTQRYGESCCQSTGTLQYLYIIKCETICWVVLNAGNYHQAKSCCRNESMQLVSGLVSRLSDKLSSIWLKRIISIVCPAGGHSFVNKRSKRRSVSFQALQRVCAPRA